MHKSLPIIVETDALDGTPIETKRIDYYNVSDRKWLNKHCLWALHNKREIRTRCASIQVEIA